jgi:hypothetical protein
VTGKSRPRHGPLLSICSAYCLFSLSSFLLSLRSSLFLEGITHQPPKPPSRPRLPHQNFLDFSKSLENSKKKIQIIENTRNIANIALIFRICGVNVSKIQVEREGGLGGWWVIPSIRANEPGDISLCRTGHFLGFGTPKSPTLLEIP